MIINNKLYRSISAFFGMLVLLLVLSPEVFASTYLTKSSVILTNLNDGQASSVIIAFTTSATNSGTNGSLVFSGWTGSGGTGTVASTQTVSNAYSGTSCLSITGASSTLPGAPTAVGTSSTGTIALTDSSALLPSTSYCYVLPNAITLNPSTTGQTPVAVTEGSDSATNDVIYNIANDQVVINGNVPPSFTMALSTSTDNFTSSLSSGAVSSTNGVTVSINTNAKSGWYLWGSDANAGLRSATQSYTISSSNPGTNNTLSAGTPGYVTALPTGSITQGSGAGTVSAATAFASSSSGNGSGLSTSMQKLASSTGTANGSSLILKQFAAISGIVPSASDYSDTITVVGSGSF